MDSLWSAADGYIWTLPEVAVKGMCSSSSGMPVRNGVDLSWDQLILAALIQWNPAHKLLVRPYPVQGRQLARFFSDSCWWLVACGKSSVISAEVWGLDLQPLTLQWDREKHGCTLLKAYLYLLYETILFIVFCPGISFINPQLPWPVCQFSMDFLQRIKSVGANERAAIPNCVFLESWQTKREKSGLFALYVLQLLEIALICCNVVLGAVSGKIIYFHSEASGSEGTSLRCCCYQFIARAVFFLPVVTGLGDVVGAASGCFADCWAHTSDLGTQSWISDLSFIRIFSCIPVVAAGCLWFRLFITSNYAEGHQFSWSFSRQHLRCNNHTSAVGDFVREWLFTRLSRVWVIHRSTLCSISRWVSDCIEMGTSIRLCQLFPGAPIILYLSRYGWDLWLNSCTQICLYPDLCCSISFYSVLFLYYSQNRPS